MGGKRKAARKHGERADADAGLIELLTDAHEAVTLALATVQAARPVDVAILDAGARASGATAAALRRPGQRGPAMDPVLLDRYQGLLVRSGVVAGSVHHLPSRLRERTDQALRDLIVGVARDRPATAGSVDELVDELLDLVGERIAARVSEWHAGPRPSDAPLRAAAATRRVSG